MRILILLLSFLYAADDKAPMQRTRDREVDIHHIKIDVAVDLNAEDMTILMKNLRLKLFLL